MNNAISGIAAESQLLLAIKNSSKIKFWQLPSTSKLLKIAQSSSFGRRRLAMAIPQLQREYGLPVRNSQTDRSSLSFSWEDVPPSVVLDKIYGIDVIVCILGYVVAIDVTANPNVCQQKKTKLTQLRPLLDQLGIDSVGVFCADESWEIWDRIKAIAKSSEVAIV